MDEGNSFKEKIKKYFTSMCSRPVSDDPKKRERRSTATIKPARKDTRQTITIDDAFIKKSRKNIVEEEFFTSDILNVQMERHLYLRIKGAGVGLIKGEFSQ